MTTAYDLSLEDLTTMVTGWGEPAYRAKQVWRQLWQRAATYDEMTDLPPALRERLAEEAPLGVEVLDERTSDRGATRKSLLRLGGEHVIETVLMGYPDRVTVCISSQSGCAMGCTFCATGQMGLRNNLTAGEIAAQVVWARREAARLPRPRRSVWGTWCSWGWGSRSRTSGTCSRRSNGSPTAPPSAWGRGTSRCRRLASCPGITHLTAAHPQVGLAVSFHAASDELRSSLVPPNDLYPLAVLEEAMAAWRAATHRRPSIEWAMIDRVNDTEEQATLLAPIARRLGAHVNLIPLNPTPGYAVVGSSKGRIRRFVDALERARVNVTVRDTRGRTIDAACGQLAISASASPRPRPAATSRSS